jgi:chitinase
VGLCLLNSCSNAPKQSISTNEKVVIAYVTSWSDVMPNPQLVTHINYAFGHVNETFNGVRVANEERLKQIMTLKTQRPDLKILVSIGGWGSGRFSEMAADEQNRLSFAQDCQRIVKEFGLDGIDIDWEYPTSSAANISSSPDDTENFTLLMRDIRQAIGKDKLLTLASVSSAQYINFRDILNDIDFVNIMSYDMANAPKHHSGLYRSSITGWLTCDEAVKAHINAGVPVERLVMGMPFYGRGGKLLSNRDFRDIDFDGEYIEQWNDTAKVPYLINKEGTMVLGYENVRSLSIKCEYILEKGLLGGMYWEYAADNDNADLARTVYEGIMKSSK